LRIKNYFFQNSQKFLIALIKTQIGSLPYLDIQKSIDISFEHNLAFIPELIKLNENDLMLERFKKMNQGHEPSLIVQEAFINELSNRKIKRAKLQIPGAITSSHFLKQEISWELYEYSLFKWLEHFDCLEEVILFFDEPAFNVSSRNFDSYKGLLEKLKGQGIITGIHNCDFKAPLDLKNLSFGIVSSFFPSFDERSEYLAPVIDPSDKKEIEPPVNFWGISPLCGLGSLSDADADEIIKIVLDY